MPTSFDPPGLVAAIAARKTALQAIRTPARRPALALAEALFKAKGVNLPELRALSDGIGPSETALLVEALSAATANAAIKRVDPHGPLQQPGAKPRPEEVRAHLAALLLGSAEPADKPQPLDKLLPPKARTPAGLSAALGDLGPARFATALRSTKPAALRTLVKKLDPGHERCTGRVSAIDADWAAARIGEIAGLTPDHLATVPEAAPVRDWYADLARVFDARPDARSDGDAPGESSGR